MKRITQAAIILGLLFSVQTAQAGWSANKRLNWTSGDSFHASVAVGPNNHLHVVWQDNTPGNDEIYYKKSTDGGTTWGPAQRLTWTSGDSDFPDVAIDSSNAVHVVWEDATPGKAEIYYRKSADGGEAWGPVKRLTWTSGDSCVPTMTRDSNNRLHVVWFDYTPANNEIYYKRSLDGGSSWSAAQRLTWNAGSSFHPAITVDTINRIHVVWYDSTPGKDEIYYRRSPDAGTSWDQVQRLTWNSGWSLYPAIAADSTNHIHVVWHDDTPDNQEIYHKKSTDGGTTWDAARRLTWTSGWSYFPVMAIDSNNRIHLAWHDDTPGNSEIYYQSSPDGGTTWSGAQRLTWMSGSSVYPALAAGSNGTLHLVWSDGTPGNYAIYYKKKT
jgi:BNR repeat-like domain